MAFRRGFKSEAKRVADEIRSELELSPIDPLDPYALASHLGVPVWCLTDFASEVPAAVDSLTAGEKGAFSAVTVFAGNTRAVVVNDSHFEGRQVNSLSHELAHSILLHVPSVALDEFGCRYWNADDEDEADFLGGV